METSFSRNVPAPVSVLMPICNEAPLVDSVVAEWHEDVFRYLPDGSEMLFDDGASTDGTPEKLESLRKDHPYIRVLRSPRDGFAKAARRLYSEARCPLVFFTDSDGQYVPREFWKIAPHIQDYDLVHGAKAARQDPVPRLVASWGFNLLARRLYGVDVPDVNSAFRLVRRPLVDEFLPQLHCMPTLINAEFLLRLIAAGRSVKSVPVAHRARAMGISRGLPPRTFLRECWRAYKGLRQLRRELAAAPRSTSALGLSPDPSAAAGTHPAVVSKSP